MKKFRGKRRYYRNLLAKVPNYKLNLEDDHWYDMWHMHVDWHGIGNESEKARQAHLRALFMLFHNFQKQLESISRPHQTWVFVHKYDAGQNAVYLHTPNENSDNFPMKFEEVVWDNEVPEFLEEFVDLKQYEFGHFSFDEGLVYVIYSKQCGIPI